MLPVYTDLRASDADREQTVAFLGRHCAEGRLSPDELSARAERAYAAVFLSELAALTRDLPGSPLRPGRRSSTLPAKRPSTAWVPAAGGVAAWGVTAAVAITLAQAVPIELWAPVLMVAIPLGAMVLFTFLPVILPMAAALWVIRALTAAGPPGRR